MKEILDSEIEATPEDTSSRKAVLFFVANLFCVLIMLAVGFFFNGNSRVDSLDTFYSISNIVIMFFIAFGLLGFRYAMLSIIKKEKWTYIKIVGVVGNLLFFIMIILLFTANVNDILK